MHTAVLPALPMLTLTLLRTPQLQPPAAAASRPSRLPCCHAPQVADGLGLPYRPGSFDAVLCIAVLHHMSSPARRVQMLAQIAAVLRPGGRALVTVWATQQEQPKKTVDKWHRIATPEDALAGGGRVRGATTAGHMQPGCRASVGVHHPAPWLVSPCSMCEACCCM